MTRTFFTTLSSMIIVAAMALSAAMMAGTATKAAPASNGLAVLHAMTSAPAR